VSLLELLGHRHRALHRLGTAAAAAELAIAALQEMDPDPALAPLREGASGGLVRAGAALAGPLALVLRLAGARRLAALAAVAGSLVTRYAWIEAGKASARDPVVPLELEGGARDALRREGERT
jgi:hypothetical protein